LQADDILMQGGGKIYWDGGIDTYTTLISNNIIGWYCGDTEAMRLTDGACTITGDLTIAGATPTITIGDGGAEDTKLVFDGNAQDFYVGIDDTDDAFKIGNGSAVGTTPAMMVRASDLKIAVNNDNYTSNFCVNGSDDTIILNIGSSLGSDTAVGIGLGHIVSPKGGIFFERQSSYSRGRLKFCVDNTADSSVVTDDDMAIAINMDRTVEFVEDIYVGATNKIYLDGGGNTYLHERSADRVELIAGGVTVWDAVPGSPGRFDFSSSFEMAVQTTKKIYLDGGSDTYIVESAADRVNCVVGGTTAWSSVEAGNTCRTVFNYGTNAIYPAAGLGSYWQDADEYSFTAWHNGNATTSLGMAVICGTDDNSGTNTAINFLDGDGSGQGNITFSGGTVSYNAFTAGHDASLPDGEETGYAYGTLVEIVEIYYKERKDGSEMERGILYKVQKSQSAYAKNVLGAYSGQYTESVVEDDNLHQIYALGDGHIICNGENGDIEVGDGICTSSTEGEGMKADKLSMIIGIAQEDTSFSSASETKLVPVQYGLKQFQPWE